MVRTEVSVSELCGHCVRKIELAVGLRHRDRARAALEYLWREVDRVYFSNNSVDDSTPLVGLLANVRQANELEHLGILTVGDFRKVTQDDLISQVGLGELSVKNICEKLALHGVFPSGKKMG